MSRKRLALACQHFYPEMASTGMHMTELAHRLEAQGWDITVYCAQPAYTVGEEKDEVPMEEVHQGIRIRRVPTLGGKDGGLVSRLMGALSYLLLALRELVRDREEYDGLLVTTNPPFLGLVGCYMAAAFDKPYVQLVYDVYPDIAVSLDVIDRASPVSWVWERITRLMLNHASATVVIGRDMAELIRKKLDRVRWGDMHLIPNWSDETVVEPVSRSENSFRKEKNVGERFLVQYAGGMGKTHNLEPLIRAAERLQDQPVLFQMIGEGDKKAKLQRITEEKNLRNVQFLPFQPRENLDAVLAAADLAVVCLESRFTGMSVPSKTYGIMASQTPILGFLDENSEIGRTIQDGDCGFVVEDPGPEEVARVIRTGVGNPERLREMGQNGRQMFEDYFTLSRAADRYDAVLRRYFYGGGDNVEWAAAKQEQPQLA